MCVWLEAFVLGRLVWFVCVDTRFSACNKCVLDFVIRVGSEFAVSDECCSVG